MAIFTLIATTILGFTAGTFAAGAVALGLGLATTIGVSYVMKALAGNPVAPATQDAMGTQGNLAASGDVPRSFGLGYHATAGSLVYANYWGQDGKTPHAYFTQVIAVSDLPGERLLELWVNGEPCTLVPGSTDPRDGTPVSQNGRSIADVGPKDHLWIRVARRT